MYTVLLINELSEKKRLRLHRQSDPKFVEFIYYRGKRQVFRHLNTWTQRNR